MSVAVVSRRIGRLPVGSLLWLLARSLLAAGLSALVAWQVSVFVLVLLGSTTLQEAGGVDAIVSLTIAGMVSAAVYAGAAMLLRIEEIRLVGRRGAPPSRCSAAAARSEPEATYHRASGRTSLRLGAGGVTTSVRVEPGHLVVDRYQVGVQVALAPGGCVAGGRATSCWLATSWPYSSRRHRNYPRAPALVEAARAAARVDDHRLMRVLDAHLDGDSCYIGAVVG